MVCIAATFIAGAGEEITAKAKGAVKQPTAKELQLLQGTWEGFMVGEEANGKITITITGNSLTFHRDTNFWFETTFTLPAGTNPNQLRATIKDCADKKSIGEVVPAIYKIEDRTLTLAGEPQGGSKAFEDPGSFRYKLQKVQPPKKNNVAYKSKISGNA